MRIISMLISIVALIIGISLSIFTIFSKDWSKYNDRTFGLFSCTTCTNLQANWTWECLARVSCELSDTSCGSFLNGYQAGVIYTYLELSSIILGLYLLEKLILMVFHRHSVVKPLLYLSTILHFLSHLLALVSWYLLINPWNSEFSTSSGVAVSIYNCGFISCYGILIIYTLSRRNEDPSMPQEKYENNIPLLGLNPRLWVFLGLLTAVIGGGFIMAAISNSSWVETKDINGGLLRCSNCQEVAEIAWVCLAGTECSTNSQSSTCILYQDLADASENYVYLEVLTLVFIMMAAQPLIAVIISREYGFKYLSHVSVI